MACPHFRKLDNQCALLDDRRGDPDEDIEQPEPEPIVLSYCLGDQGEWRQCSIFRLSRTEATTAY
jgi:hypothetical protein